MGSTTTVNLGNHHSLTLPVGWTAQVWAKVPGARMEAWSPDGDLLVSEPGNGKVVELSGASNPTTRVIASGLTAPQGLAFARLGATWVLYVGESDQIDRYT